VSIPVALDFQCGGGVWALFSFIQGSCGGCGSMQTGQNEQTMPLAVDPDAPKTLRHVCKLIK